MNDPRKLTSGDAPGALPVIDLQDSTQREVSCATCQTIGDAIVEWPVSQFLIDKGVKPVSKSFIISKSTTTQRILPSESSHRQGRDLAQKLMMELMMELSRSDV